MFLFFFTIFLESATVTHLGVSKLKTTGQHTRERSEMSASFSNETCPNRQSTYGLSLVVRIRICCGALGAEIQRFKFLNSISNPKKKTLSDTFVAYVFGVSLHCFSCGFGSRCSNDFLFYLKFRHFLIIILLLTIKQELPDKNYYMENSQSIKKKCHLFLKHLKPLSAGFNDSTIIQFNANIGCDYDVSNFGDPLQILNHLRNELLPIFSTARCYEFLIRFFSHGASVTNTLDSILQMPQIISSTNVKFSFYRRFSTITTQFLPVAAISAWLDRSFNGMIIKSQKQQKSPLELTVYIDSSIQVQSVFELFENLKKVHLANLLHRRQACKVVRWKFRGRFSLWESRPGDMACAN